MKKFVAIALMTSTMTAIAAERNIYDLMYLPKAGTVYGLTDLSMSQSKVKYDDSDYGETKTKGWDLNQVVGYSISDRLSVQAEISYAHSKSKYDIDGQRDTVSKGLTDPTLTARYRVMEESLILDVVGGALVQAGNAEEKSNGDSNMKEGGSSAFVGAQLGQKSESLQWTVGAQYTRNFKAKTEVDGGKDTKDDAHNQWELSALMLNKLGERSYLRSNLGVAFVDRYEDNEDSDTASSTTYQIGTAYQHVCSEKLLLRAGVDYVMVNTNSGLVDSVNAWNLNLGATYQF